MFENYSDIITVSDLMAMLNIGKSTAYSLLNKHGLNNTKPRNTNCRKALWMAHPTGFEPVTIRIGIEPVIDFQVFLNLIFR